MLAKSLVAFIVVGVVSGLAFGIYLMDVRSTGQLVYVEGPSVSIVTEKFDFRQGEEVKIWIVNSGTVPLTHHDTTFGLSVTGLSGVLIWEPVIGFAITELEPGREIEFVWDQTKADGDKALEGLYKISVEVSDEQGNAVNASTTITIWK